VVSEDETLPKTQMPIGMEGELWIGGVGVAKGYLHAPDLTKEVVRLPPPLSATDCRSCISSTERNLHHSHSHSHSYL
jgi:non-ribosomal peptide synthetase component F